MARKLKIRFWWQICVNLKVSSEAFCDLQFKCVQQGVDFLQIFDKEDAIENNLKHFKRYLDTMVLMLLMV